MLRILVLVVAFPAIFCQNTTSSVIAPHLKHCYNQSDPNNVIDASSKPASTLNMLLDVIRNIEDTNTKSTAVLTEALIATFKQDGIRKKGTGELGIPYSAILNAKNKYLQENIFGTSNTVDLTNISPYEQCAMHLLVSSSENKTERGDESITCALAAKYTSRIRRATVELLNVENGARSTCPTLTGVVLTNWGEINVGDLLGGIAAGAELQATPDGINSIYAATIAGELGNSLLATQAPSELVSGTWQNKLNPKLYYLNKDTRIPLTDPSIRGSLDGYYIGRSLGNLPALKNYKLSQLIDMYYSSKGLLNDTLRACNRKELFSEYLPLNDINNQTILFMKGFSKVIGTDISNEEKLSELVKGSADSLQAYISSMSDVRCEQSVEENTIASQVLIFVDTKWNYDTLQSVLSYILEKVNVNKYQSNYTIISGNNGTVLVNSTSRLIHLFEHLNDTTPTKDSDPVFNYKKVLEMTESLAKAQLANKDYKGGKSNIVLLMPNSIPTAEENIFAKAKKDRFKVYLPDLTLFVYGAGDASNYDKLLENPSNSFVQLDDLTSSNIESMKTSASQIVSKIAEVGRALVNPNCGLSTSGSTSSFTQDDVVENHNVNYYRISPYYFSKGSSRALKVKENSKGSIYVCVSQQNPKPSNTTNDECSYVKGNETSINVDNFCSSSCSQLYVSVEGVSVDTDCTACRFPRSVPYTIGLDNVGCGESGAIIIFANFAIIGLLFMILAF